MAKEQAVRFLEEMHSDEKVVKYLRDKDMPRDEQALDIYAQAAAAAGYDFTIEELKEAVEERRQTVLQMSQSASDDVKKLSPEELDGVAGEYWWAADDSLIDGHELFLYLPTITLSGARNTTTGAPVIMLPRKCITRAKKIRENENT